MSRNEKHARRDGMAGDSERTLHLSETLGNAKTDPNIFVLLTDQEREKLISRGRETKYAKGEYFFQQGEPHEGIHFIQSGRVRSFYISPNGREITLAYWTKSHFVGAPQIFGGGEHMWSSVALEPTVGLWIPGGELRRLIPEMPNLALALIDGLVYKAALYTALVQIMGTRSMSMRLAHLLLTFANTEQQSREGAVSIQEHFSHEEIANMIGATRQYVSQSLEKFEDAGLIRREGRAIHILDVEGLRAVCY